MDQVIHSAGFGLSMLEVAVKVIRHWCFVVKAGFGQEDLIIKNFSFMLLVIDWKRFLPVYLKAGNFVVKHLFIIELLISITCPKLITFRVYMLSQVVMKDSLI